MEIEVLPHYIEFITHAPSSMVREEFLEIMRRQATIQASGLAETASIVRATRARHLEELSPTSGKDFTLRAPKAGTHPIYRIIWD